MTMMVSSVISVPFIPLSPSTHDEAAIHRDGLTGDVARCITRKPQNNISNLLGPSVSAHGDALLHCFEHFALAARDHLIGHWSPNQAGTDRIDSNAPCCVFESRTFGEAEYTVLGGMVDPTLCASYQPTKRRTIDYGSTSLFAHLLQL